MADRIKADLEAAGFRFAGRSVEGDPVFRPDRVREKYGLTQEQWDTASPRRPSAPTTGKAQGGQMSDAPCRLAMRVEGNWWVAYCARMGTMAGATELGRMRMSIA